MLALALNCSPLIIFKKSVAEKGNFLIYFLSRMQLFLDFISSEFRKPHQVTSFCSVGIEGSVAVEEVLLVVVGCSGKRYCDGLFEC